MKLLALIVCSTLQLAWSSAPVREFSVDYANDQFLLDGEPWRYVSGSMHYFRVLRSAWRARLRAMRAAGLNAVTTYIEWGLHEPSPGIFDFDGENDIEHFIGLAQEEGLLVMLRPGPYICAERDFGGLPPWLLTLNPEMSLRSSDPNYQQYVSSWFRRLMPRIVPHLYGNGGPVVMVQVENEYGSYDACDAVHTAWLRDEMLKYVGDKAVLFTTDGNAVTYLRCGKIPGVYATVDFGPAANVSASFASMRVYEPRGPLVNSEFYPGWLTHWEESWQQVNTSDVARALDEMLRMNASVNFYVFMGGTNFGFTSGANFGSRYQPTVTSYDYDAPLTEAGDPTAKYLAIRDVIARYLPLPELPVPDVSDKGSYGSVELHYVGGIFDPLVLSNVGRAPVESVEPLSFEQMGQNHGFVLYETRVPESVGDPALLAVPGVRDRAIVALDGAVVGALDRAKSITQLPLLASEGQVIQLLVENQGRVNYGKQSLLKDFKGILGNVTLDGGIVSGWTMTGLPLNDVFWLESRPVVQNVTSHLPGFFRGEFTTIEPLLDTFLDMTGFGKGVVFINGHNLGRYWPKAGPISTLYVPAGFLVASPATNQVVVFELESIPVNRRLKFVTEHKITTWKVKKFY